jgi:excinuclease ABC subunit C
VRSEPEALLLEGRLIKEFQPRYNISFRDDKQFILLKVNLRDPIPQFTLTRLRKDDGARYFGPFVHSAALRNTLALVRRQFNLRGCRAFTPGAADYKHCLYGHLKYCTAPCIGNVTQDQYLQQVLAACDFLEGQCLEMRAQLEAEMRKAAAAQDYEKAAQLRDLLRDVGRTTKRTEKFERLPYSLPLAIDPERDLAELARALELPAAPRRIDGFDISNISGTFAVASLVSFKNGRPDRANYRRFKMKTVVGQNDFACMAETVRRRYSRLLNESKHGSADPELPESTDSAVPSSAARSPDAPGKLARKFGKPVGAAGVSASPPEAAATRADPCSAAPAAIPSSGEGEATPPAEPPVVSWPDLILIDGGKGQLGAACEELARLGLSQIPVIGLAKEFEEIYRPGADEPLRLPHSSGALKLLQRVRDESHRFANTYNAQLRLKKISESILDDFPGIGEQRKLALLKKFGSVQRLRLASQEEIAEVPGFGGKAAAELRAFLLARQVEPRKPDPVPVVARTPA